MKKKALSIAFIIAIGMTQAHASANEPVVRNITSDKLPSKLQTAIRKDYKNKSYWITDCHKTTANGKTSYHVTVENPDKVVKLAADQPSAWVIKSVVPK